MGEGNLGRGNQHEGGEWAADQLIAECDLRLSLLSKEIDDELMLDSTANPRQVAQSLLRDRVLPLRRDLSRLAALSSTAESQKIKTALDQQQEKIQELLTKYPPSASVIAAAQPVVVEESEKSQYDVAEIAQLEVALDRVSQLMLDVDFDPATPRTEFGNQSTLSHLQALKRGFEVVLPALAEQNAIRARRLSVRYDQAFQDLTALAMQRSIERTKNTFNTLPELGSLRKLLVFDVDAALPGDLGDKFKQLAELKISILTKLDYDNLNQDQKVVVANIFLDEVDKKLEEFLQRLNIVGFRDVDLETSNLSLKRLWELAVAPELTGFPVYQRHSVRGELEDILIDLSCQEILPDLDHTNKKAIDQLQNVSVNLDVRVKRYTAFAISRLLESFERIPDRFRDLQTRYEKIKNNDFSVEPVTVEDVAQLGEDLSYARSALKSKRFIAAIKPLNSPALVSATHAIETFEFPDTFIDIVKIQELRTMSYENLAKHCLKIGVDPYAFQTARSGTQQEYYAEVVRVVKERLFAPNPEDTPWKDHQRKRWLNFLAVSILDNKGQYEAEVAATTKTAVAGEKGDQLSLQSALSDHLVTRDELISVTSLDPEYGDYFSALIDGLKVHAALKAPPKDRAGLPTPDRARAQLLAMSPGQLKIHNPIMTTMGQVAIWKGVMYQYNPAFDYSALTNESTGRTAMRSFFKNHIAVPDHLNTDEKKKVRDFVIDLACRLYTGLTVLDESFFMLQASTATRGHNATEKDYGNLYSPTTASVHKVFRYSAPRHPSIITSFPYRSESRPDFYFLSDQIKKDYSHSLHMARLRQDSFFDTSNCFEQLDFPGFLELSFPESSSLFTANDSEQLWVVHEDCIDVDEQFEVTTGGVSSLASSRGKFTHKLLRGDGKVLAYRDDKAQVYTAAGNLIGKMELAPDVSSVAEIEARRAGKDGQPGESRLRGYFQYATNPRLGSNSGKRVLIKDAKIDLGSGDSTGMVDDVTSRTLYYTALRGMEKVFNIIFSPVPGGLTPEKIVESSGGGTTLIGEFMSSVGMLKMFPNYAIDNLIGPYLTYYCHRLLQSYSNTYPRERTRLATMMVEHITQTAAYGGLARSKITRQIKTVVDSLITIGSPEPGLDTGIWKPRDMVLWKGTSEQRKVKAYPRKNIQYYRYTREAERNKYLTELWQEERPNEPMPPLGFGLGPTAQKQLKKAGSAITGEYYDVEELRWIVASQKGTTLPAYLDFEKVDLKAGSHEEKKS